MPPSSILFPSTHHLPLSSLSLISPTLTRTHFPGPTHIISFPSRSPTIRLLPPIRMGGGPRTFPGGVSKWQWKRMQAKKSKQLLKARLLRERHIYEMRKRAELKAAVSELEKPWELVQQAPALFSVAADEQVKALADRFQRPGGFDMWSDRDGPQILRRGNDGVLMPSERFFPKGVVHSVRPYGVVGDGEGGVDDWIARGGGGVSRRRRRKDCREGVRGNADERGSVGDSGVIDVEARGVNDGSGNGYLGMENSKKQGDGLKGGSDERRGVRGNASEGRGGSSGGSDERRGVRGNASEGRGRSSGGSDERRGVRGNANEGGQRGSSGRRNNGERVRLRPTSELSSDGGRSSVRDLGRKK